MRHMRTSPPDPSRGSAGLAGQSQADNPQALPLVPSPSAGEGSGVRGDREAARQLHERRRVRWRLILGAASQDVLGGLSDAEGQGQDRALGYLYDREYGPNRNVRADDRAGGLGESVLGVPDWINMVHELFPRRTVERLERDALEEMVTNPELLARAEPSQTLLKAVLRTKHPMNQEVLAMARQLVRRVVDELMERLARQVHAPFVGALDRRRRSPLKVANNFDARTTIRRNLKRYDPKARRLTIETPYFYSRVRRQADRWQLIILVDESGSMLDSVIHAAVTASIFVGVTSLRTSLCIFDTAVVDLSADCADPVETLMKVQLGGGTDIGGALSYAASLVDDPRRALVVLITDFYEGAPLERLLSAARGLLESGVTLLGLAALDEGANPTYDHDIAGRLVQLGAHAAAMTPGELADWVAEKVR